MVATKAVLTPDLELSRTVLSRRTAAARVGSVDGDLSSRTDPLDELTDAAFAAALTARAGEASVRVEEVRTRTLVLRDGEYLIEEELMIGAVNNFCFNESTVELLGRSFENDVTTRTLGREFDENCSQRATPTLRVVDLNMSSVNAAN